MVVCSCHKCPTNQYCNKSTMNQKGIQSLVCDDYSSAKKYFIKVLQLTKIDSPEVPVIYYHLAMCEFELKNYNYASIYIQMSLNKSSQDDTYYLNWIDLPCAKKVYRCARCL